MNKGKFITAILCALAFNIHAQTSESTKQLLELRAFPEGLVLTGDRQPTETENSALINALARTDVPGWTTNVENFLRKHPASPWTASLRHDYAQSCRQTGRTTKALEQWEAAWTLVKNNSSPEGRRLAGTILANWMEQLASLGRYEKLQELSAAGDAMSFSNPADRDKFQGAKSSWLMMTAHPGMAFRCGTFALKAVGNILQPGNRDLQQLVGIPSPTNGFSMAQLIDLSHQYKLDLTAVKRTAGRELIVPSVVHWRQNHYAAILEKQENFYRVSDPTFGTEKWLTAEAINEEAGGEFLIPAAAKTDGWQPLEPNETELVHGMGLSRHIKDANDKGCKPGEPCPPCTGMPVWWVTEPYLNLWIADEPMSYRLSTGEAFTFRTTYKQRDTRSVSGYGGQNVAAVTGWNHSWLSLIYLQNKTACSGGSCAVSSLNNCYATLYLPDGGTVSFAPGQNYDPETHLTLVQTQPSVPLSNNQDNGYNGLRLVHPDGSQDIYGRGSLASSPNGLTADADFFRSRHIDPHGRTTWYYYGLTNAISGLVLLSVVDPDGRTNVLRYANGALAEVISPDGLSAKFGYDANKNLTNIVDAQGLSSTITYGTNSYPTALITPYGTNTFGIFENYTWTDPTNNLVGHAIDRAIQVTDPVGATSLYLYRDDCSTFMAHTVSAGEVPTGTPLDTLDDGNPSTATFAGYNFYNSFYWGPRQYASLSTTIMTNFTANDYVRGRMQHWLEDSNLLNVTAYVSIEREPSPDGSAEGLKIFYDYQGKYPNFNFCEGTNPQPAVVAWRLPGGESHWQWSRFDGFGNLTNLVSTATLPDGTLGMRTNQFVYLANRYLQTANISTYNNTNLYPVNAVTVPNLLAKIIAADGQTVWSAGGFEAVSATSYFPVNSTTTNYTTLSWLRVLPRFVTNAVGNVATLTFSGFDQVTSLKSFSGLTTTNLFSNPTNGFLLQTIDLEVSRTNSFSYTTNGLISNFTNELGLNVALTWDNLLRPVTAQFSDGTYTSNRFDKLDLAGQRDRLGKWTYFAHDGARHLTAVTNANNAVTSYNWCGCGALESILDALTNLTVLNHDNAGRLTGYNFPDNSSVTFLLDLAGRTTNAFDSGNRNLAFALNHQGLATNITDALNHSLRRTTFDLRDRPNLITDANGITLTNIFDPLNRLLSRVWPDNIAESFGFNERGLFAATNRHGKVTLYGLDVAGRRTSATNANLEVTQFAFNPADEITSLTDGLQHQRSWKYNEYGWVTNKTDGLNRTAFRYQYNLNGWLTNRWTTEKGNTAYTLDNVGNVTNVFYAGQNLNLSFGFDALNQLTSMNDLIGLTRFTRDAAGRVIAESNAWTTVSRSYTNGLRTLFTIQQSGTNWTQSYAYDLGWRLTNTVSMAGGFLYQFLDARPNLPAAILLPNGASITNSYDSLARLKSTALQDHWRHTLDGYTYGVDALGLRTNILRDLGLTTNSVAVGYDNINQILSWNAKENDGTPRLNEQLGFGYDAANNLHTRISGNLTQTFTPDAADQLSSVTRSGTYTLSGATPAPASGVLVNGQTAQTYGDFTFARTNLTLQSGTNTFSTVAVNTYNVRATNVLTVNLPAMVTMGYDNNANLTNDGAKAFFYDCENQLTNVTVINNFKKDFVYDGLNRLRIKREYGWISGAWQKTNESHFIWDGNVIAQIRDASNNPLVTLTRGLDLSGSLQGSGGIGGLLAMTVNGTNYYYHQDGNGNVTAIMDSREQIAYRAMYDPFNRILRQTGNYGLGIFGASGQLYDQDTRLLHYQRRAYAPELARWLNDDPIGEIGGINLPGFVGNDPVNWIDPLGLQKGSSFRPAPRPGMRPAMPRVNANGTPRTRSLEEMEEDARAVEAGRQANILRGRAPNGEYLEAAPGSRPQETPEQVRASFEQIGREITESAGREIAERENKQAQAAEPCPPKGGVYVLQDPISRIIMRTGRSDDLERREGEHKKDSRLGSFDFRAVYTTDNYSEQRGLEQMMHNRATSAQGFPPPFNYNQPISSGNPNYINYMSSAQQYLNNSK